MSRPLRLEYPGALYHVSARGNAGQPIFLKDGDREQFLLLLGREIAQARWTCFAYCLLEAEYRLLVQTPEANLGRGIGRLNAVYSQWFNRHYGRNGHLFQGRYRAIVIDAATYLLPMVRDLAWAPVRGGLCKRPGQWFWSSHRPIGKDRNPPSWLAAAPVLAAFAGAEEGPRKGYRTYVAEGKAVLSPLLDVRAQMYLGDNAFLRDMAARIRDLPADQVPDAMLHPDRPTKEAIIAAIAEAAGVAETSVLNRHERADVFQAAVYLLRRGANLSLKEVAAAASVSPPRISQIQRSIEDAGGLVHAFRWAKPLAVYLS